MECDRHDLRVLYTVDPTLKIVKEVGENTAWTHEYLTPQQYAFLRDRPALDIMWGFLWVDQTNGSEQPDGTVSVLAYEYVRALCNHAQTSLTLYTVSQLRLLLRWHSHGVRHFGRLRIYAMSWKQLRDLVLTNEPAIVIDLFDRYHFIVLTDYSMDLR